MGVSGGGETSWATILRLVPGAVAAKVRSNRVGEGGLYLPQS